MWEYKRGILKHQKEWHTCDRCGKEIATETMGIINFSEYGTFPNEIPSFGLDDERGNITICAFEHANKKYELCSECEKDFERFMRNGREN